MDMLVSVGLLFSVYFLYRASVNRDNKTVAQVVSGAMAQATKSTGAFVLLAIATLSFLIIVMAVLKFIVWVWR